MNKIVLMIGEDEYEKYITNAAKEDLNVITRTPFQSQIKKRIFRFHNAWPLNKNVEMPFKWIWYRGILDWSCLDKDEKVMFVFYESFHLSYSKKFLAYLHKKYKHSQFSFVFHNPADEYNLSKLKTVREYYDVVLTFYESDAKKYGFLKPEYFPYRLPVDETIQGEQCDVFFIGSDKGRLPKLLDIYERITQSGFKCKFFIVGVDPKNIVNHDGIVYNQKISYDEVLERVKGARCILEVLQHDDMYSSIREIEAFQYRKQLLTTNINVKEEPFYNPKIIQVINNAKEIDTDFLRNNPKEEDYPSPYYWSFAPFREILEKIYKDIL